MLMLLQTGLVFQNNFSEKIWRNLKLNDFQK